MDVFKPENYKVKYFKYDVDKFPFIKLVESLFDTEDLSEIHNQLNAEVDNKLFTNENDDETQFHEKY